MEALAESMQAGGSSERGRDVIFLEGIGRAEKILLTADRWRALSPALQEEVAQALGAALGAGGPDAHEPDVGEASPQPEFELRLGRVGEQNGL